MTRLVFDLQGAQTQSRFRGIGRYTRELALAMIETRGSNEIFFLENASLASLGEEFRAQIIKTLGEKAIISFRSADTISFEQTAQQWLQEVSVAARDFVVAATDCDIYLISSLIEGFAEDALYSMPGIAKPFAPLTATIAYDFIPAEHPEDYLSLPIIEDWYNHCVRQQARADIILAISESCRKAAVRILERPSVSVVTIMAGQNTGFDPKSHHGAVQDEFGDKPFVLTTGGIEKRKNVKNVLKAFSALPERLRNRHRLVVYGVTSADHRATIKKWAVRSGLTKDNIVVLGYLDDAKLARLYRACRCFVFASFHEGFGFPLLEAMQCGAVCIQADKTSLPEISTYRPSFFDPHDIDEIRDRIERALEDKHFRREAIEAAKHDASRFTWARTATATWSALTAAVKERENRATRSRRQSYLELQRRVARLVTGDEQKLLASAAAIDSNLEVFVPGASLTAEATSWRIEGPFDSSYSLALLNRETALAFSADGLDVALHSTEGPGDFEPSPAYLAANPSLAAMHERARSLDQGHASATSRNLFPPRVKDMRGGVNMLHHFAWEESALPQEWVRDFNESLDAVGCLSEHVRKILLDSGVHTSLFVSGCGVDHWERIIPNRGFEVGAKGRRFLHVSSCFPRKGAEVLLKAFGRAFTREDDVTLIIKTFDNPHNVIAEQLAELRLDRPDFPDVVVLNQDFPVEELKALYESCDILVAPSFAEGFGLPLAEAMLSGLGVITTGWGGQLGFCNSETSWLLDFSFEPARTHLSQPGSIWARPDEDHLVALLRECAILDKREIQRRAKAGRALLLRDFKWSDTVDRLRTNYRSVLVKSEPLPNLPKISWVSSWNTKCGIALYSRNLVSELSLDIEVLSPDVNSHRGIQPCCSSRKLDDVDGQPGSYQNRRAQRGRCSTQLRILRDGCFWQSASQLACGQQDDHCRIAFDKRSVSRQEA